MNDDDRARRSSHHGGAADAGAHGKRMRMEETHLSNDAGQNRHPKRAEDRSADIHAHYAVAFRRIQAEALRNNGDVGFSVNGVARADRFAFHADEERHRQTEDQRAEEVAEFLHDQRPAGLHDHFNIRTDIERDLRDQQKNAHGKHLAGAIHFFEPHDAPAREAHQCTEYKCIKQRQKHD